MPARFNGERAYFVPTNSPDEPDIDPAAFAELRDDFIAGWNQTNESDADSASLTEESSSFLIPGLTMGEVLEASMTGHLPGKLSDSPDN